MSKKTNTAPLFYLGLLAFTITMMVLIVSFVTSQVNDWLYDYEYSQAKYKIEEIFDEYFSHPDIKQLSEYAGLPEYNEPEDAAVALDYMQAFINGKKITYSYVAGSNQTVMNVKADGEKFARFSIRKSEDKSPYGYDLYELDKIELYYQTPQYSGSIQVPFYCTVYANGLLLSGEYITDRIDTDDRISIPEGAYEFYALKYEISGLYSAPVLTVFDASGKELTPKQNDDGSYIVEFSYNDALKAEYSDYVIKAMQAYAAYMQDDEKFRNIRDYFDKTTELYNNIYDNPGSFVWPHDGYRFENAAASEFYAYGDDCFSCRVVFDHVLEKKGSEDYYDHLDMTLYLHKTDGDFVIYFMLSN